MVTLFHDMMHKEVEVYVDDMIATSKTPAAKYRLRLNPAKCTFGVGMGKLLGFIVNEKRIELDPDKSQSISALGDLMTIATGVSLAIPRIYTIATSSVGRD
ncbi:hypothetical protein CR513_37868, partial [Mucuna pruriens]